LASEKIPEIGIMQIPLIHAWAITIHKSQGATLDAAQIDIGNNIFECGQTYVALSRIKSLEGLYLIAFNPLKIKIYKKVEKFYKSLAESVLV
jgi:ATP-dependent DNA helicase PIF1